jgi:anaerobic selenocysteine-containing dehydrogenase
MEPSDQSPPDPLQTRREFLEATGALSFAVAGALGGWAVLEKVVPPGTADEWHRSVCRYCGTGLGVTVGLTTFYPLFPISDKPEFIRSYQLGSGS